MASPRKLLKNSEQRRLNINSIEETAQGQKLQKRFDDFVIKQTRFGKRILLHQIAGVPKGSAETKMLAQTLELIEKEKAKSPVKESKKLSRLNAAKRVLEASIRMKPELQGRNPHVFHIAASIGLMYGFNSPELLRTITTMTTMYLKDRHSVPWIGAPNHIYDAVRKKADAKGNNWPSAIEETLHASKNTLNSKQLLESLGHKWNLNNINLANVSLQLLETAGLVKKLPEQTSVASGGQYSVWVHRAYKSKLSAYEIQTGGERHYSNTKMEVIHQLAQGARFSTQLFREKTTISSGKKYTTGNPKAIYKDPTIIVAIESLKESGIANTKREFVNGFWMTEVSLTPLGKQLWNEAVKTGTVPERLRKLLVGERD